MARQFLALVVGRAGLGCLLLINRKELAIRKEVRQFQNKGKGVLFNHHYPPLPEIVNMAVPLSNLFSISFI